MEKVLRSMHQTTPGFAIVDIGLTGISGIEGIAQLKQAHPGMLVLMLTVYDDDRRIFDATCAGACGYLLKTT
jgi:DNA-binding NarL/FixJ family response regulator